MNRRWELQDLVDLEYFLHMDENRMDIHAGKEEREMYLERLLPMLRIERPHKTHHRRVLLRLWLEERRRLEKDKSTELFLLPGEMFIAFCRMMQAGGAFTGCCLGFGGAVAFLHYSGKEPLNVWTYLLLFVGVQMGLLALLLLSAMVSRGLGARRPPALLRFALAPLFSRMVYIAAAQLTAEQRGRMQAAAGLVSAKSKLYGKVFAVPFVITAQLFGVGFNLGLLGGTLLRVLGSDLAFGWQSTVQWSAKSVYALVEILAVPWAWVIPAPLAHPTLAQVEGSRIFFKDGIRHLATQDLVSWWPFLIFAVICYGLLPRLLLLISALAVQGRLLARLPFDHAACDQLLLRLTTPVLETTGEPPVSVEIQRKTGAPDIGGAMVGGLPADWGTGAVVALVPVEISSGGREGQLQALIKAQFGFSPAGIRIMPVAPMEARSLLKSLADQGVTHVLLLQEAWQPPIFELLRFFKEARAIFGPRTRLDILLIGRPGPETPWTKAQKTDSEIWTQRIAALADPYLTCFDLKGTDEKPRRS